MKSRIITLSNNPTKLVVGLDFGWEVYPSAVYVPFDNDVGKYKQGYWDQARLEQLLVITEGHGQVMRKLMQDKRISSPDNLLFLVDIVMFESDQGLGYGTDALNQLYEQARRGIDLSDLSSFTRNAIMPQNGPIKFYEYLMGVVQDESVGFFEKRGFEKIDGPYMGISLR